MSFCAKPALENSLGTEAARVIKRIPALGEGDRERERATEHLIPSRPDLHWSRRKLGTLLEVRGLSLMENV